MGDRKPDASTTGTADAYLHIGDGVCLLASRWRPPPLLDTGAALLLQLLPGSHLQRRRRGEMRPMQVMARGWHPALWKWTRHCWAPGLTCGDARTDAGTMAEVTGSGSSGSRRDASSARLLATHSTVFSTKPS